MNTKIKTGLIDTLKFLNTKPGFSRLFYWIHEIRADIFDPKQFLAVKIDEGFLFGTYNFRKAQLWKRVVHHDFEPEERDVVKSMIPQCDAFIDIGAHIGFYSCFVHSLKPGIFIMAFEPNKQNYKNLVENFKINHIDLTHCYNLGIGEKKDRLTLYGTDAGGTVNTKSYAVEPTDKQTIDVVPLSAYTSTVKQYKKVFIKMDVEAFEYPALLGAEQFIKEIKPIGLLIEISRGWSGGTNPNFEKTFALLDKMGYRGFTLDGKEVTDPSKIEGANFVFKLKN